MGADCMVPHTVHETRNRRRECAREVLAGVQVWSRGYFSIMGGLDWIMPFVKMNLPVHQKRVELTCGRGELIWHTWPAQDEILNDKDTILIRLHQTIQGLSQEEVSILRTKDWVLRKSTYDFFRKSPLPEDRLDYVYRVLYLFRGGKRGDEIFKDVFMPTKEGEDLRTIMDRIVACQWRMRQIKFTAHDACELLETILGEKNTFVFIDPPYPSRERYYRVHDLDWGRMANLLRDAECKWMLVSDINLSPRVGTAIRNRKRIKYIMDSHQSLLGIMRDFAYEIIRQDYRLGGMFSNLDFTGRQKEYAIVANYELHKQLKMFV